MNFFFFNNITEKRLFIFFCLLFIILIYRRLLLLLESNTEKIEKKIKLFNINNIKLSYFMSFLLILNTLKNPLLFLVYYMELLIYKICKWVNYMFFDYYYLRYFVIIFFMNIILIPIKFLLEYYYIILNRFKNYTLKELLFKRIEGVVLGILIFTNIILYIKYIIQGHEFVYIFFFLIIMGNLFKYGRVFNYSFSINRIIKLRYDLTIFGFLIKILLQYSYENNLILGFNINFKYCLENSYLENKMLKTIDSYKIRILNSKDDMFNEIKNKPSGFIYTELTWLFEDASNYILKWNDLWLNKDKFKDCDLIIINYLFEIDRLRIQISLFLIWYLDDYYGYSTYEAEVIKLRESFQDYSGYLDYDYNLIKKLESQKSRVNNLNLPFFDYDNNISFWNCIFSLHYNEKHELITLDGVLLGDELNETNFLTDEQRKEWFFSFIKELRVEFLSLKEKHFYYKTMMDLFFLLEKKLLELDNIK